MESIPIIERQYLSHRSKRQRKNKKVLQKKYKCEGNKPLLLRKSIFLLSAENTRTQPTARPFNKYAPDSPMICNTQVSLHNTMNCANVRSVNVLCAFCLKVCVFFSQYKSQVHERIGCLPLQNSDHHYSADSPNPSLLGNLEAYVVREEDLFIDLEQVPPSSLAEVGIYKKKKRKKKQQTAKKTGK